MNSQSSIPNQFQPGGSLPADAPTYVVRQADRQLFAAIASGHFCTVLNSRQMGKSSLRVRAMRQLEECGVECAEIELSGIGSQEINAQQWYGGIIQELISGFDLELNRRQWMNKHQDLSPVQQLKIFIETVLLQQVRGQIAIFIDEVDSVLSLDFKISEFFGLIRHFYDKRSTDANYQRLTFTLLGVATPSELMERNHAVPFNVGQAIELKGFQADECEPLARGLMGKAECPQAVIEAILRWTNGQPFLTQKLCWLVVRECNFIRKGREKRVIESLVDNHILEDWESQDEPEHLRTIRDRLLRDTPSRTNILELYQKVARSGSIPASRSQDQMQLRLSGVVAQERGHIRPKNRIYQFVFTPRWVAKQLARLRPQPRLPAWAAPAISAAVGIAMLGMRSLGLLQPLELAHYDRMIRLLPNESPDPRLVIIGIDEADIRKYGHPLPDWVLAKLLDRISGYQPATIGLDMARDRPVGKGARAFVRHLERNEKFVGVCAFGGNDARAVIAAPPHMPMGRVGYVDVYSDSSTERPETVRRYLLSRTPVRERETLCTTSHSLGFQLAYRYFMHHGTDVSVSGENWVFGKTVIARLRAGRGGYQQLDDRGNQMLIRYRKTSTPEAITTHFSIGDVLASDDLNREHLEAIRDRVVLIGVTAASVPDLHDTPLGRIRGLYIQAHALSQLLSHVDEGRPQIWALPGWGDGLWVVGWCSLAGGLIWVMKTPTQQILSLVIVLGGGLLVGWYGFASSGLWLPVIPTSFGAIATAGSLMIWHRRQVELHERQRLDFIAVS
ncbi:MAG: CHASE2 domain-containing protein [Cyanobacteria bacterium J06642_2]